MKIEDYINPIISFLVFTTFAVLLYGIRVSKQVEDKDKKGLDWFSRAFLLWAIVGLLRIIGVRCQWDDENWFIGLTVVLSYLNSICFLTAITFIQVKDNYSYKQFVEGITAKWALIIATFLVLVGTVILAFAFGKEGKIVSLPLNMMSSQENVLLRINGIWSLDLAFSLISVTALAVVIRQALKERHLANFNWLVYGMLFFLILTQFLQLIKIEVKDEFSDEPVDSPYYTLFIIVVSLSYKIVFCMVILVLLYSWRVLGFYESEEKLKELQIANAELSGKFKLTHSENENLLSENLKLNKQLENVKQEFAADKEIPLELTSHSIEFLFSNKNKDCMIRLCRPFSRNCIEIDFTKNIKPFKKLLRLAINKKFHVKDGEEYLNYSDENPKVVSYTGVDDEQYLKYFEVFTYSDDREIKKIVSLHFNDFEESYIKKNPGKICLKIPEVNIILPSFIEKPHEMSSDKIFMQFHQENPVLQASRGA